MEYSTFANIAEENAGFVYNVAYRMMGNPHDAEEVAQDAFVSAFKARKPFQGRISGDHLALPHNRQRRPDAAKAGQEAEGDDRQRRRQTGRSLVRPG